MLLASPLTTKLTYANVDKSKKYNFWYANYIMFTSKLLLNHVTKSLNSWDGPDNHSYCLDIKKKIKMLHYWDSLENHTAIQIPVGNFQSSVTINFLTIFLIQFMTCFELYHTIRITLIFDYHWCQKLGFLIREYSKLHRNVNIQHFLARR